MKIKYLSLTAAISTACIAGCSGDKQALGNSSVSASPLPNVSMSSSSSLGTTNLGTESFLPDSIILKGWSLVSYGYAMSGHTPALTNISDTLDFREGNIYQRFLIEEQTPFQRYDGCNSNTGHYFLETDTLSFSFNGYKTLVACVIENDVTWQEQNAFVKGVLQASLHFEIDNNELVLTAENGEQLIYANH